MSRPLPPAIRFLGIGAQRAGTTWLHEVLETYPDCALPTLKELHYFDIRYLRGEMDLSWIYMDRMQRLKDLTLRASNRIEQYHASLPEPRQFSDDAVFRDGCRGKLPGYIVDLKAIASLARYLRIRKTSDYVEFLDEMALLHGATTAGEITPSYSLLPAEAFAEIATALPDCRIIFIMRDPVARLLSQLRFRKRTQKITESYDPSVYLDLALADKTFLKRSEYRTTIENLESAIPRDRILYLFFEEMIAPDSVVGCLRQVENLLQLKPKPKRKLASFASTPRNSSETASFSAEQLARAGEALAGEYRYIAERFGRLPPGWLPPG